MGVDGRPACGGHLPPQMAVLTHGVGVLPGHSHPHQQVGKGGHHQGGGGQSHHGDVVGGHRARLVVGGGHQHGPGGLQHNHSVDNFWNSGYETGGRPRTQSVSLVRNFGGGGACGSGRSLEESGRLRTASLTSRHHRLLPSIPSFTQLASLRNRPRLASSSFRSRASSTSSSSFSSASTSSTSSSSTRSSEEFWNQYRRTPSSNLLSRLLGRRRETLSKEEQEVKELNLSNKVKL